jgi:hypothetical protein
VTAGTAAMDRIGGRALRIGVGGLVACAAGFAALGKEQFFRSYLLGFVFVFGIAFGCLAVQMIHALTGGRWGMAVRRPLIAASSTLPLLGLFFVPLLAGMPALYPWARPEAAHDALLVRKAVYLNVPGFAIRAALLFGLWSLLALQAYKRAVDGGLQKEPTAKLRVLSGPGLLFLALSMTVAAIDWLMSLDPHWTSTMFSAIVMVGQLLSAIAFVISMLLLEASARDSEIPIDAMHDLGNLLLVFVMMWAYFSYSQYLIIYAGNMAETAPYFHWRSNNGWQHLSLALIVLHFAVPFLVLISKRSKRRPKILGTIAAGILVMRVVENYWVIGPNFHHEGFTASVLDIAAPIGLGGVWLWLFLKRLVRKELEVAS